MISAGLKFSLKNIFVCNEHLSLETYSVRNPQICTQFHNIHL